MAKPPVVSLCCQVGCQVVGKFGPGISQSQAGGLVEAVVARLALGIAGEYYRTARPGQRPKVAPTTSRGWHLWRTLGVL